MDDIPLFVSPCILSTTVNIMQECDNKVVQKSRHRIGIKLIGGRDADRYVINIVT